MIFRNDIVPTCLQAELYHSTIHHSLLLDCSALVVLCCVVLCCVVLCCVVLCCVVLCCVVLCCVVLCCVVLCCVVLCCVCVVLELCFNPPSLPPCWVWYVADASRLSRVMYLYLKSLCGIERYKLIIVILQAEIT